MKISTERFKEAVNKAAKGAGNNSLIPLTSMIGICAEDNKLNFYTTDATSTLQVVLDKVQCDPFSITVSCDIFSKLVSKQTCDEIELSTENGILILKGNGKYKIPIITDEEGEVQFPQPKFNVKKANSSEINLTTIQNIYNINRSSLAQTMEAPELTGYYVGDKVISTDACVICINDIAVMENPILVSAQLLNLLTLNSQEKIKCHIVGNSIMFDTADIKVYSTLMDGIDNYPVEPVLGYLDQAFESSCKVPKGLLLSVLDRLSLFIEQYDKNGAYFTFGRRGITIRSKKGSSDETIAYIESNNFKPFVCCVDIPMLKAQLEAYPEDDVTIHYGLENAIKLTSGKVTQVISLLEDEDLESNSDNE
jgi:DNA polymerase sliding clamp subunit (PCNA homolog)